MRALKSGEYDLNRTALMMSQTGGMCRASNYIGFIHKALDEAGLSQIPVISLNTQGFEPQPGFKFSLSLATNLVQAVIYGDALQQCLYRTRPYELTPGSAEILCRDWQNRCCESILKGESFRKYKKNLANIIKDFDRLPLNDSPRRRESASSVKFTSSSARSHPTISSMQSKRTAGKPKRAACLTSSSTVLSTAISRESSWTAP